MAYTSTNIKEFKKSLKEYVHTLNNDEIILFQKIICVKAVTHAIAVSAVDEGYFKNDWQIGINFTPRRSRDSKDESGNEALNLALGVLNSLPPFSLVVIANNRNYAEVIDQGLFDPPNPGPSKDPRPDRTGQILVSGGFSTQSPEGIIEVVIQELKREFP